MPNHVTRSRNRLLARVDPQDEAVMRPALQGVSLEYNKILYEAGRPIEFVYFPSTGVASMVKNMSDGNSAEVGTVGNEGIVASPLLFGFEEGPATVHMQIPGEGVRLPARVFRDALARSPSLQRLMQAYAFALFNQVLQLAACNHFHDVEQRCARWMLMVQDRMPGDDFPLTHEVLSLMLGVRRSSVTVAAGRLSDAGLIDYRRGKMTVVNREGLERRSCECYRHPTRIRAAAGWLALSCVSTGRGTVIRIIALFPLERRAWPRQRACREGRQ